MKLVIYTAAFGPQADELRPTLPIPGVEYVCFTDRRSHCSGWLMSVPEFLPCNKPGGCSEERWQANLPRWMARQHKLASQRLFPEADATLWLDGRVQLKLNPLQWIDRCLGAGHAGTSFWVHRHPDRTCLFTEAGYCSNHKLDDPEILTQQTWRYFQEGFPQEWGLFETGVILRRRSEQVQVFEEAWWREVSANSFRDQVSLPYVAARCELTIGLFPGTIRKSPFFRLQPHKKRASAVY